jgi:3-phytase
MKIPQLLVMALLAAFSACETAPDPAALHPDFVTDPTPTDTDDPAIWIHPTDPMQSLILGTDKGDDNGGVFVFDLRGKLIPEKSLTGLPRPNNVDVEYGFMLGGDTLDIAVFTLRNGDAIRIVSLPDMRFIDGGPIEAFAGEEIKAPMGVALYKRPTDGAIFAFVSRKSGPDGAYIWQYALRDSAGVAAAVPVRKFGAFKGRKEIEAIAVDDALGYVYYSDEGAGVRKYHADPDSGNAELALFATEGFRDDHEGISIYEKPDGTGYILVSDQQANRFQVFTREGSEGDPHAHQLLAVIPVSTNQSDGSETSSTAFGDLYPKGFFVAMSDNRTFQIYRWELLEEAIEAAR